MHILANFLIFYTICAGKKKNFDFYFQLLVAKSRGGTLLRVGEEHVGFFFGLPCGLASPLMYGQERAILNTANHREQTKNRGNSICVGVA